MFIFVFPLQDVAVEGPVLRTGGAAVQRRLLHRTNHGEPLPVRHRHAARLLLGGLQAAQPECSRRSWVRLCPPPPPLVYSFLSLLEYKRFSILKTLFDRLVSITIFFPEIDWCSLGLIENRDSISIIKCFFFLSPSDQSVSEGLSIFLYFILSFWIRIQFDLSVGSIA